MPAWKNYGIFYKNEFYILCKSGKMLLDRKIPATISSAHHSVPCSFSLKTPSEVLHYTIIFHSFFPASLFCGEETTERWS